MSDSAEAVIGFIVALILIAGYVALVVVGVKLAKSKNRSPHWMWFALHPVGLIIVLIVLAAVGPLKVCGQCREKVKAHARVCPYCGAPLVDAFVPTAASFPAVFATPAVAFPYGAPAAPQALNAGMMSDTQMVATLRQLCDAYERNDSHEIERLEPIATEIGNRLHARGGLQEMRRVWQRLHNVAGARTLDMHWDGIGEWRG